jgi:hypothetical protein
MRYAVVIEKARSNYSAYVPDLSGVGSNRAAIVSTVGAGCSTLDGPVVIRRSLARPPECEIRFIVC